MKQPPMRKRPFPVENARRYLEPGPVVLVSSFWRGRRNVTTVGWYTVITGGGVFVVAGRIVRRRRASAL